MNGDRFQPPVRPGRHSDPRPAASPDRISELEEALIMIGDEARAVHGSDANTLRQIAKWTDVALFGTEEEKAKALAERLCLLSARRRGIMEGLDMVAVRQAAIGDRPLAEDDFAILRRLGVIRTPIPDEGAAHG